jgi:hypothetical protein
MNVHVVAGVLLLGFGVAYGIASLMQVVNGTGLWIRKPKVTPSVALARAGGWVGVGMAAIAVLLGVNQLVPTASAFAGTAALLVLGLGGVYGLVLPRRRTSRTQ